MYSASYEWNTPIFILIRHKYLIFEHSPPSSSHAQPTFIHLTKFSTPKRPHTHFPTPAIPPQHIFNFFKNFLSVEKTGQKSGGGGGGGCMEQL